MGKRKFNAKGRQVVETIQDDSSIKQVRTSDYFPYMCGYVFTESLQIKLDIAEQESQEFNGYDASNALILPSKKRDSKFKKNPDATNVTRILSKKQRKNLEKIVDKKKKREQVIPIAIYSIVSCCTLLYEIRYCYFMS